METKFKCLLCGRVMDPVTPQSQSGPPHDCAGKIQRNGVWKSVSVLTEEDRQNARPLEEIIPELLEIAKNRGPFTPNSFYNEDGDMLEVYLSEDPCFHVRVDNILTILFSDDDHTKVVGYHIKNISRLMPRIEADLPILNMSRMD